MMRFFAILDESGTYPVELGTSPDLERAGAVELPEGLTAADAASMLYEKGEWYHRPYCPVPTVAGHDLELLNCPAGAFVEIEDLDFREYLGRVDAMKGEINCTLPDPGRYRIMVTFGEPWLPITADIEVSP